MAIKVSVVFETAASHRFLRHTSGEVQLDGNGKGSFEVQENESDLILFGIQGNPGTKAKITLSVPASAKLVIAGHPIEGQIAADKTVWGSSRFFSVQTL